MRHLVFGPARVRALGIVAASLVLVTSAGQAQAPSTGGKAFKTPWGEPDLQGAWSNATITPLQRPARWAGKEKLTPEEIAKFNQDVAGQSDVRSSDPARDVGQAYNAFWWDRGESDGRTALIVDPVDGKIPPLTAAAQKRREEQARLAQSDEGRGGQTIYNGPEELSLYSRCVIRAPLPRVPTGYDNNYQIVQSPGLVAILQEQMHETRVIPVDGRPHLDASVPQLLGDSRGRWEGDTLVVETKNFSQMATFEGSSTTMKLVERFRRISEKQLEYQFTVEDPTTWERPWTARWNWNSLAGDGDHLYEYACHEGNYGLENILAGSRVQEREAAQKK